MTTFVIVHGAWGGSYAFRHVKARLESGGHKVFTVSLTGIGERSHLAHPMVNLTTHIQDLVNVVLYEDLRDFVLVGFSYGGFVVTGALPRLSGRIRHLVYLDAFVPKHGDTALKLARGIDPPPESVGQEWFVSPAPRTYDDPAEAEWMDARRSPQPLRTLTEPVQIPVPIEDYPFKLSYIKATDVPRTDLGDEAIWAAAEKANTVEHLRQYYSAEAMWQAADHAKQSDRWDYYEIDTNHMVMCNRPDELAVMLAEIATGGLNLDEPELADVCGVWRLKRFAMFPDGPDNEKLPYGKKPEGRLMIMPNFYMSAIITPSKDADEAHDTFFNPIVAYSGLFTWESSTMTTVVDVAWQKDWPGTLQPRRARIVNGDLELRASVVRRAQPGKSVDAVIVWSREI